MSYRQLIPVLADAYAEQSDEALGFLFGLAGVGSICGTFAVARVRSYLPVGWLMIIGSSVGSMAIIAFGVRAIITTVYVQAFDRYQDAASLTDPPSGPVHAMIKGDAAKYHAMAAIIVEQIRAAENPLVAGSLVKSWEAFSYDVDPITEEITYYADTSGATVLSDRSHNNMLNPKEALRCKLSDEIGRAHV